jgi:hypothetical protein
MVQETKPTTTLAVLRVFAGDLLVLAVLFLAAEGILRLFAPQELHHLLAHVFETTEEGFRFQAGASAICNNGYGDHVFAINSWRARDREYGPKQPGEWRLLCLGDSFSENQALEVEDIWPNALESDLAAAYPDRVFSVVNAGQAGWGIWSYHDYLEEMLSQIDPDVVVVAFGNTSDWMPHARRPGRGPTKIWAGRPVRRDASVLDRARFMLWYGNELLEGTLHAYVALRELTFYPGIWTGITKVPRFSPLCTDAGHAESVCAPTAEVMEEVKSLCDANGVRLVLMSVPKEYECLPGAARLKIELERPDVAQLDLARPARMVERLAAALEIPWYDPADDLGAAESRPYFVIFQHWNVGGNRIVAAGLRRFLETHNLLGD